MSRELSDAKWDSHLRANERAREQAERYTPPVFVKGPHWHRTRRDFNQQSQPDASWLPEDHNPATHHDTHPGKRAISTGSDEPLTGTERNVALGTDESECSRGTPWNSGAGVVMRTPETARPAATKCGDETGRRDGRFALALVRYFRKARRLCEGSIPLGAFIFPRESAAAATDGKQPGDE